jgi:hypothetical protein
MQVLKEENYMPMKYLIAGATGNIGALVVERLLGWGHRPRVFVRDTAKARAIHGPCVDISVGDLADAESIANALRGIDTIFLINSGPDLVGPRRSRSPYCQSCRHETNRQTFDHGCGTTRRDRRLACCFSRGGHSVPPELLNSCNS